jgi:hypothetical protein
MFMNKTVNLLDEQLDAVAVTLCAEELGLVAGGCGVEKKDDYDPTVMNPDGDEAGIPWST